MHEIKLNKLVPQQNSFFRAGLIRKQVIKLAEIESESNYKSFKSCKEIKGLSSVKAFIHRNVGS